MAASGKPSYYLSDSQRDAILSTLEDLREDKKLLENFVDKKWLARAIGISPTTLNSRLLGETHLKPIEASIMYNSLGRDKRLEFLKNDYIGPHEEILGTHRDLLRGIRLSEDQRGLIKYVSDDLGIKQNWLAKELGLSKGIMSHRMNGKIPLSPDEAIRIYKTLEERPELEFLVDPNHETPSRNEVEYISSAVEDLKRLCLSKRSEVRRKFVGDFFRLRDIYYEAS